MWVIMAYDDKYVESFEALCLNKNLLNDKSASLRAAPGFFCNTKKPGL